MKDLTIRVRDSLYGRTVSNMAHVTRIFHYSMAKVIPQLLVKMPYQHRDLFVIEKGGIITKMSFLNDIKQYNNKDCGVFVSIMMEAVINGKEDLIKFQDVETYQHARMHILDKIIH